MSQSMSNEIQNIHYCTILSSGQWDFLLEGRFSPLRQKCLYRLMNGAVLLGEIGVESAEGALDCSFQILGE